MTAKWPAIEPGKIQAAFRGSLGHFSLDASFAVPARGVTAIFGASGSGKTTVARCLAGLHYLPGSFCTIDGDAWQDETTFRKTHQRPIGYVFQEASLFSHLTVKRNLLYGAPKDVQTSSHDGIGFDEVIELLGLARLLDRSPHNLSGGERQRVAIGRALLSQPKLLLMDEPLSALDRSTKNEILPFLERLHARLSLPVFYISHDMSEIERLADHLVLMQHGHVVGAGPLQVLQSDPSLPLAAAREAAVSPDATVEGHDPGYGLLTLRVAGGRLLVPAPRVADGTRQRLRIAASDVSIARAAPDASSILNVLPARIVSKSSLGPGEVLVVLSLGTDGRGAQLLARITLRSWDQLGLAEGMNVFAQVKGVSLVSGPDPTGDRPSGPDMTFLEPIPESTLIPDLGTPVAGTSYPEIPSRPSMRDAMIADVHDIDPNHLAAILYRPEDDVDALLADFASALLRDGERIGGIVQRNLKDEAGRSNGMLVIDLMTGRDISISQTVGSSATACKLDPAGLADASLAVSRAIAEGVDLIIVNKFSKQEAAGHGLRSELAEAIITGGPVLTAVPEKCLDAWKAFTGDRGTTLLCAPHVIAEWWREVSSRRAGARAAVQGTALSATIFRSSHRTT
jgi:molybdate transport system ATP-binding protein